MVVVAAVVIAVVGISVVVTAVAFPYPRQQNMRGVLVGPLHCSFAPQFRWLVHCFASSVQITATTPVLVVAVGVGFFFGRVFNVVHDHQQRGGDLVLLFVVNELFGLVVVNDCVVCLFVCLFVVNGDGRW